MPKDKWWQRAITKEKARNVNMPKSFKGDKFSVPTNFSDFAPELPNAPQHRST